MSKFAAHLVNEYQGKGAYLIKDERSSLKSKKDYVAEAEEGTIIAFRLNFEANDGASLTKVISGIILNNDKSESKFIIETRNGLKYVVPYDSTLWVKTGDRWPRGVYDEMKQGAVVVGEPDSEPALEANLEVSKTPALTMGNNDEPDAEEEAVEEDVNEGNEILPYEDWTKEDLIAEADKRAIDVPYVGIKRKRLKREKLIELFRADDNIEVTDS